MGDSAHAFIAFGYDLGEANIKADFLGRVESLSHSDDCPIEIVYHNHYEYPIPAVIFKDTLTVVYSGSPRWIHPTSMGAMHKETCEVFDWCRDNGIPWRTPSWMVMPNYG